MLLPKSDTSDAIRIAERIRRSVEALGIPHAALGARGVVTVSCGAAAAPVSTISAQELIAAADAALYAAKAAGRNCVRMARPNPSLVEPPIPTAEVVQRLR